jgi:hypothetical protein
MSTGNDEDYADAEPFEGHLHYIKTKNADLKSSVVIGASHDCSEPQVPHHDALPVRTTANSHGVFGGKLAQNDVELARRRSDGGNKSEDGVSGPNEGDEGGANAQDAQERHKRDVLFMRRVSANCLFLFESLFLSLVQNTLLLRAV